MSLSIINRRSSIHTCRSLEQGFQTSRRVSEQTFLSFVSFVTLSAAAAPSSRSFQRRQRHSHPLPPGAQTLGTGAGSHAQWHAPFAVQLGISFSLHVGSTGTSSCDGVGVRVVWVGDGVGGVFWGRCRVVSTPSSLDEMWLVRLCEVIWDGFG